MRKTVPFLLWLGAFAVSGCGSTSSLDDLVGRSPNCTVEQTAEGASIRCPDGTQANLLNGAQGPRGLPGAGCDVAQVTGGAQITCANGAGAFVANGMAGERGASGTSCSVVATATGAQIACEDGSSAALSNGADGAEGRQGSSCTAVPELNGGTVACSDGTSFFVSNGTNATPLVAVRLCRDDTSTFPEYGFRLGQELYAVYYDSTFGAFWAKVVPGVYRTTNGSGCIFTVGADGQVI